MQSYTFTGPKGGYTTVQADTETEARHLAMVERWGPISIWDKIWGGQGAPDQYSGYGLSLVSTK